jgi:hypothetical protein
MTPGGDLRRRQAALVAALVAGAPVPAGFDTGLVAAARAALRRKRAAEVARHWPLLAGALADRWPGEFLDWCRDRPPAGALRDGWDFARGLAVADRLPARARVELAGREVAWRYDGRGAPRRRWLPAARRVPGGLVVHAGRRTVWLRAAR